MNFKCLVCLNQTLPHLEEDEDITPEEYIWLDSDHEYEPHESFVQDREPYPTMADDWDDYY